MKGIEISKPSQRAPSAPSFELSVDRRTPVERYLSYCFYALSVVLGKIWLISFGWWLDPLTQRRKNQALWDDVQENLYFLYSRGQPLLEKFPVVHPFDYASVKILFGNVQYCFTRGRGELNVTVAPRHAPNRPHELSLVIASLDSRRREAIADDFGAINRAIHSHLLSLDEAFSKERYSDFEKRLP